MKNKKISIAFDVNGTLTDERVRQLFLCLDRKKCHLIVWSTIGPAYAKKFCEEFNLAADEYLGKEVKPVDIAIDDYPESILTAQLVLGLRQT